MSETDILQNLATSLSLDTWWVGLLGQAAEFDGFDERLTVERLPRTEIKAAREIHNIFGANLSYIESRRIWYLWDGKIHRPCDGDGIAIKIIKLYYDAVSRALAFVEDSINNQAKKLIEGNKSEESAKKAKEITDKYDKLFRKHREFRDRLSTDAGMTAMVRVLRTECDVPSDYYDNDQRWFVTNNWVLDVDYLREFGEFSWHKHDPSMAVTRMFDADFTGGEVNLGFWDDFITKSVPDQDTREYLQKITGAAFMGSSKLRCIPNLYGPPGSGKSVFLGTFYKLAKEGSGYSQMPDSKAVVKVSGQNFEQDKFRCARFSAISEPMAGEHIDDDFLKKFTGDEWMETRTLNVKSTGWAPQGVIFIASNKTLKITTRDKAIVERVQLIEFPNEFRKDSEDPAFEIVQGLEGKIMEDRSRVLLWVLQGMREFVKDGCVLDPPQVIKDKRNDIVINGSQALRWVEDYIEEGFLEINHEVDPKYFITVKDAYLRYQMWAATSGEKKPLSIRFFLEDIQNKYGEKTVVYNTAYLTGIKVTETYRSTYQSASSVASQFSNQQRF